jgi:hypothetical protein
MATKQIPDLTPTSVANDTDLAAIRQGIEDKRVEVQYIRDRGSDLGQTQAIGEFGLGGEAKPITDYFGGNDANLITRTGIYVAEGTSNTPEDGEIIHVDKINGSEAGQILIASDGDRMYWRRRNVTWWGWGKSLRAEDNLEDLGSAAVARENLDVYDKSTVEGLFLHESFNLSDLDSISQARTNIDVYSKSEGDARYLDESENLNDLPNKPTARTNLDVYSKSETDGAYLSKSANLSDLPSTSTSRTNLDVYSKAESSSIYLNESANLSDLPSTSTSRTNLDVYSKTETDNKYKEQGTTTLTNVYDNAVGSQSLTYATAGLTGIGWYVVEFAGAASQPRTSRTSVAIFYNPEVLDCQVTVLATETKGLVVNLSATQAIRAVEYISGSDFVWWINRIDKIS